MIFEPLENANKALCGALCLQVMQTHYLCIAVALCLLKNQLLGVQNEIPTA